MRWWGGRAGGEGFRAVSRLRSGQWSMGSTGCWGAEGREIGKCSGSRRRLSEDGHGRGR